MQLKPTALACGLAFAALAGSVSAATLTFNPQITVNASGASALRLSFGQSIVDICDATQTRIWFQDSVGGSSRRAYYCTLRTDLGLDAAIAGKRVMIHKRDSGGSSRGVTPVALGLTLSRMAAPVAGASFDDAAGTVIPDANVEGTGLTCTVQAAGAFADAPAGWTPVICGGQFNDVPKFGLSDVDAEAFVDENKDAPGEPNWSPALASLVTIDSTVGVQGFGVAVNKAFYEFLQQKQGLNVADPLPGANQPSLSSAGIASLLSGGTRAWSQMFTGIPAGVSDGPKICRRTNGSGTQASSNRFFLNYPCVGNLPATNANDDFVGNDTAATAGNRGANGGAYQVVMNAGSGDVPLCLEAAQTQNEYAIAVLSYENRVTGNWRYVKVDGVSGNHDVNGNSPTAGFLAENFTDNVANGLYGFAFEFIAVKSNTTAGTDADKVWDTIVNRAKDPANLFRTSAADGVFLPGLVAHALSGFVPTSDGSTDPAPAPVARYTRLGNFCGPMVQAFPLDLVGGGDRVQP